ncbi:MAG: Gfo/Idh/MocA family oxidoreductase [Lentisphaerae bacterium]|jgi:predicted dehydrogenase|nr:Gfo/Idh/MocA family oxidoreductase [Lentisphaerota bacterium]MBT4816485.1 Gfo/Idh/MocA family oxidoreductase [Lentisphaerota bacterium]MBT5612032.1 Gfo/Idh/MocA family oxidoreductase [Lentisphaerota bacterium]MBT7054780.1 Gfo/Idh/MocA family oxidoreductase [Lentisphaerota bacterium]MBT7846375.1 Gfo/Idh/MocA family oxidoreductase [Lentisphaerota bacterium]
MLGYAIIGCGYVSGRHVEAAINQPNTHVAVLCDVDETAAKNSAEKYGLSCPIVTDYRQAVTRDDVDIVVVGVPTPIHRDVCAAAAQAGKHLYIEKPFAQSLAEAREMMDLCATANVKAVVGHSHRYFPALIRAKELVKQGAIGRVVKARSVLCYHKDFAAETRTWKLDASLPLHGSLLDVGVHAADDIHFVTDSRTVRVYAEGLCARPDETSLIDVGTAVLRLENGAVAEWEVSETQATGGAFPCQGTTEIYGTLGSILVDNTRLTLYTSPTDDAAEECHEENLAPPSFFGQWQNLHQDLVDSILNDTPVPIPAIAGYRSLQVVDAVFTSIREHRAVDIAEIAAP